jgi:hypothetical protein
MSAGARQLRVMQIACILLVLACVGVSHLGQHVWLGTLTAPHWFVIVAAIWSAISGFTFQRRIVNRPARSRRPSSTSTPFTRWRAGHIGRLSSATAVGMWALLLSQFAGPRGSSISSLRSDCCSCSFGRPGRFQPKPCEVAQIVKRAVRSVRPTLPTVILLSATGLRASRLHPYKRSE